MKNLWKNYIKMANRGAEDDYILQTRMLKDYKVY